MESRALIDGDGSVTASGTPASVPWWSFTKTVLATAALRLVEDRRADLDERMAGTRYSLAHLLRHESGLPDYGGLSHYHDDVAAGRPPWPVEKLLAVADAGRLRFRPGEGWAYSNIGYLKVAQLIQQASGLSLADALQRYVFTPAAATTARLATQPGDLDGVEMGDAAGYHPGWVYHGLVVGTAPDAARVLCALVTGKLLPAGMLVHMAQGRPLPEHRSAVHPEPAYGLGLMLHAGDPLNQPLGHSGGGPGSQIAVYALGNTACAVWASSSSAVQPEAEVFSLLGQVPPPAASLA